MLRVESHPRLLPRSIVALTMAALSACGGRASSGAPASIDDGWAVAAPAEVGLDRGVLARIDSLEARGELGILHSVVIVKDGKLVFERYYPGYRTGPPPIAPELDGMKPNRPFPPEPTGRIGPDNVPPHTIQSASKGITALVVGAAVDRGLLQLDRRVAELLPQYTSLLESDPRKSRMTLRHVLTMTTGLDWKEAAIPYQDPRNLARRLNTSDDWARFTLSQPMADEPGTRFEYCSGCTLLLSAIVQRATGRHVDEFAEEALFRPLQIEKAVWIRHARSPDSLSHTGGGLWLRPRDFAKLGWLVVDGGRWNGRQIVSEEWIHDVGSRHVERGIAGYGYQWLVRSVPALPSSGPEDLVYAWGAAGQFVFAVKPLRMVVVVNGYNWEGDAIANPAFGLKVLETAVSAAER
jgi:CubicO group peptidase (beta-lactamase class C family)